MNERDKKKIIRQRTKPNLFDFCFLTTRSHKRTFLTFNRLLQETNRAVIILDAGCGYKPFQALLKGVAVEKYVGVDFDRNRSVADIEATVDNLPLKDNSFDAVIVSEALEHVSNLEKAVGEIRRVAKNGALIYISTPFMFGEHGIPYDFQRITQYKYRQLFQNDEILFLAGTNSNLSTLFFVGNVVLENISAFKIIPLALNIVYFFNNIIAMFFETLLSLIVISGRLIFSKKQEWFGKIINSYFYTMPGGYNALVKIKK